MLHKNVSYCGLKMSKLIWLGFCVCFTVNNRSNYKIWTRLTIIINKTVLTIHYPHKYSLISYALYFNFHVNFNFQNGIERKKTHSNSFFLLNYMVTCKCNVSYRFIKFRNIDHDSGGNHSTGIQSQTRTMLPLQQWSYNWFHRLREKNMVILCGCENSPHKRSCMWAKERAR